jgi:DNA polymerase (family X)
MATIYDMTNAEIARLINEMAAYYEMEIGPGTKLGDPIRFKPRAYMRAAQAIESFPESLKDIYRHGGAKQISEEIRGVGPGIAAHIASLIETGKFDELETARKRIPVNIDELMRVEGIGPRAIKTLWTELKVKDLKSLEAACLKHEVDKLAHFGEKSEQKILKSIELLKSSSGRHLLDDALRLSRRLEERLRSIPGVKNATAAGSVRRRQETIGDIDILVTASDPAKTQEAFVKMPEVKMVVRKSGGEGITSVILQGGIHADVRVLKADEYGAGLQYFTGDKNHNIKLRALTAKKGFKLSEYGLFKGDKKIAGKSEEEIYEALGMKTPPPEIRSDSGEIEAAIEGRLPNLIGYGDIRGDLQVQTDWTDGEESIGEMALKAKRLGLEYIAVTDHTVSLAMTGGLDEKGIARQMKEIAEANRKIKDFRVLAGSEVNIMKDGRLDINDATLARLDVVGASVHSYFNLSKAEQTKRVIAAMENPNVDIIFHLTGRKIGKRPPIELDIDAIIKAAKRTGTALEVNASPDRLDLRDEHVKLAVKAGVKLVIDSDAHASPHFGFLEYGIAQARRGWATKTDVLNTLPVDDLLKWMKTPKGRR